MKMFKRGLAMMLACMMLVMAVPFGGLAVYAQDVEEMEFILDVPAGEESYVFFTPTENGYYTYYSASDKDVMGMVVEESTDAVLAGDDDSGENNNFSMTVFLKAGETYLLKAHFWNSDDSGKVPVYVVPVKADTEGLPVLQLGEGAEAILDGSSTYAYFAFTADKDGYYAFYSSSDQDTYGIVENLVGEEIDSDDDGGEDWNFRVVCYLNAGETCKLAAKFISDATGSFMVYVEEHFPHIISNVEFRDLTLASYELQDYGTYPEPQMYVYYADGACEERTGHHIYDDENGYYVNVTYDVEYADWKMGGVYNATARIKLKDRTITGSFTVTVEESPILRVEVEGPQYIVNYDGWSTYDSIYNEETDTYERTPNYQCYSTEPKRVTIYLKDGSVWENGYVNWNGRDYWINYNSEPQNYENQWGVGYHTVQGTVMGYDFSYDVEIVESPVASIEIQPLALIENVDGYLREEGYWDEEKEEYVYCEYFYYYVSVSATVTMKDGTVFEDTHYFTWNDRDYYIESNVNQRENPLQFGMNYLTGRVLGYEYTIPVEIISTPIASVDFYPLTATEYTNGYWREGTYWDEETQQDVPYKYYHYNVYPRATITMKDGTVYEDVSGVDWNGGWHSLQDFEQNREKALQAGYNYVSGSILGYEYTLMIEIKESPIASVVIPERVLIENSNGNWTTGWDYDENGEYVPYEYFEYWSYGPQNATITLKDGTVYEDCSGFYWDGEWQGLSYHGQSYSNRILPGRNERNFSIMGYEGTYVLNVVESPVASVVVEPIMQLQYSNGYWREGSYWNEKLQEDVSYRYFYYHSINPVSDKVTITLKDGTVIHNNWFEWGGTEFHLNYDDQEPENYLQLGINNWHASIAGYDFTYVVDIVETPIASIEVAAPLSLVENRNGRWDITSYWDEELQEYVNTEFYYYNYTVPTLTVTMKDGTVHTVDQHNTSILWNGRWYELELQSQYNGDHLRPGRNVRTGSILSYEFEYEINVNSLNSNDAYEYMESEDYVIITNCYLSDATVEIPATINGKPVIGVTSLSSAWATLKHLILPDSVVTIGDYLLSGLENLESVHFGAGVSNLTAEMFGYCWNLQSITISEDNPYYCVANLALHNKTLDTLIAYPSANENPDYIVPATVVNIDVLDWYGVYNRINVIFPEDHIAFVTVDGVTYNKEMTVVISCRKDKTGDYVMPETVEEIAPSAFMYTDLTSVVVSPKVTEIVYCAFASCANLETVILPEGLVSIEQSAFEQTESLHEITLPDTLEYLGTYSFYKSGLTALSVPDSVTTIDDNAFNQSQIQVLDLGNGLQTIGYAAFANTPVGSVVLPESLTELGGSAFANCGALSSVTIGSGLTHIGSDAFARTASLLEITIPGTVDWIDEGAFADSALKAVTLSEGVGFIGNGAFRDCNNLTEMYFPASVYYVSSTAFNSCSSLTKLTVDANNKHYFSNGNCIISHDGILQVGCGSSVIPNDGSVQCIEGYAFYDCDSLQSIVFPDSLEIIGEGAFEDCDSITSVVIPDSVTTIGVYAFSRCDSLVDAKLGDGVEFMGALAFFGCPLQSVDLGNHLPFIAPTVFSGTALSTVFIPDSVTSIMYYAFENCENLTSIELPISVTTIEWDAFYGCDSLTDVYYQGTEADRENIDIDWGNDALLNATWHYGWVSDKWAELPTCDHEYDSVCDSDCNLCGARRKAPHAYENACAEWCSLCKEWRETPGHIYDNACDDTCNECGEMRAVTAHWYDNACDDTCNECGAWRETAGHVYDNACDVDCNECGAFRKVGDHVYDNKYDADCNECGAVREALSPITLVVDSLTVRPGDTFDVAVRVENNTGLVGLRFEVVYDEAQFELIGATAGADFSAASFGPTQSPFSVLWVDAIHPNNMANGTIVTLTFCVKEGAVLGGSVIEVVPSADDFIDDQFEAVRCETVSGTITLVETTPGDADGDGVVSVVDLGYLQRLLTGWDVDADADALDVNKDGKLNNRDVALLQRYLNGWDVTLQ